MIWCSQVRESRKNRTGLHSTIVWSGHVLYARTKKNCLWSLWCCFVCSCCVPNNYWFSTKRGLAIFKGYGIFARINWSIIVFVLINYVVNYGLHSQLTVKKLFSNFLVRIVYKKSYSLIDWLELFRKPKYEYWTTRATQQKTCLQCNNITFYSMLI